MFLFECIYVIANAPKLTEKCFLDLRNILLNQENIRKFFSKQEDLSSKERFSRPFDKKVYLYLRKWSQNKNNFLETRAIFLLKEVSFNIKKISLVLRYILISSQIFLQKGQENFS